MQFLCNIFHINVSSAFIYFHWYLKRNYTETTIYQTSKWKININKHKNKHQINKHKKLYILLFIDIINYKNFDSDLLKTDNKPYKNTNIYYITHITKCNISGYQNIHSGNPFYLIIGEADGYIEEKNEKNT